MVMTNRQWLETLTDEELLKIIYIRCVVTRDDRRCPERLTCEGCQLKWLQAEYKGEL